MEMKKILIVLCLMIFAYSVDAQPPGGMDKEAMKNARVAVIKGKIMDAETDSPVEFASVALYSLKDSSLITGVISGSDGSFTLKELPFGKYYIVAKFMGYDQLKRNEIMLTPRQITSDLGNLSLKQSARELDEVEIVADQAHVEYRIDRKVINVGQDINAATGTAVDILENTPSVNVDIDGNVSLRGSSNFTVLIDGKPSPLSGSDALQQIPASAIRNIELITNPSAKYDPDGMAGIINIVSKKNALRGLSGIVNATLGTGDKYSGDFLLNYKMDKLNVYAGATYRDQTFGGEMNSVKEYYNTLTDESSYDESFGTRDRIRSSNEFKLGMDYSINDKNSIYI